MLGRKGRVHFTLESFKGNMGQSPHQEDTNHFGEVITNMARKSLSVWGQSIGGTRLEAVVLLLVTACSFPFLGPLRSPGRIERGDLAEYIALTISDCLLVP